jgi:hypothetical protein
VAVPRINNFSNYKRCRCPKWINGVLGSDGPFIRRSAKTRSWEKAEDFKRKFEEEYEAKEKGLEEASRLQPALVNVKRRSGKAKWSFGRSWISRRSTSPY